MYQYCKVFPATVLKMSLGEVNLLLVGGIEDHNEKMYEHYDLVAAILNSPMGYQKENGEPWEAKDFIQKNQPEEYPPEYYELQSRINEAAGMVEQGWD
jgi:hypothetical protein